jgi:hypothetical protein
MSSEVQLPSLPSVTPGKKLTIPNVPFYGDMTFEPVIIQWEGLVKNPFYSDENFKTVGYYLNKSNPERKSTDKNTFVLQTLFTQHPDLQTKEHLSMPLGKFAQKLRTDFPKVKITTPKGKTYDAWRTLTNVGGSEDEYISFKVNDLTMEQGLYIWVIDNQPLYVGIAGGPRGLSNRINLEYGKITPYKCSIDGQSQTCRSNVKLRDEFEAKKSIALYVVPINTDEFKSDPKFIEVMSQMGFKGTRSDKNVLEIFEKFIIDSPRFKGGWNRRR